MATIRISLNEDIERILEALKSDYPALDYPELFKLGLSELYRKREMEADAAHAAWMKAAVAKGLESLEQGKHSSLSTEEIAQAAEQELSSTTS